MQDVCAIIIASVLFSISYDCPFICMYVCVCLYMCILVNVLKGGLNCLESVFCGCEEVKCACQLFLPHEGFFAHCCCSSQVPGTALFVSVHVHFGGCEFVYLCVWQALAWAIVL